MFKRLIILIAGLLFFNSLQAQFVEDDYVRENDTLKSIKPDQPAKPSKPKTQSEPSDVWDKLFYGGDFSFQFGDLASFSISGALGYKFTPELRFGFDLTYQYARNNRFTPPYILKVVGGRIFSEYLLSPELFLHAEYEILNFKVTQDDRILLDRIFTAPLVGAGYNYPISNFISIQAIILYNLDWDENVSIYQSPLVTRINFRYNF